MKLGLRELDWLFREGDRISRRTGWLWNPDNIYKKTQAMCTAVIEVLEILSAGSLGLSSIWVIAWDAHGNMHALTAKRSKLPKERTLGFMACWCNHTHW